MSALKNKKLHVLAVSALLVLSSCGGGSSPASSEPAGSSAPAASSSSAPAASSSSQAPVSSSQTADSSEENPVDSGETSKSESADASKGSKSEESGSKSEESSQSSAGYVDDGKNYTYNTYTAISPSNWNELTYQDSNDTQIMSYISSGFFNYNYKFDEDGKPLSGAFDIHYTALANAEDVTLDYAGDENYSVPENAESGYAYEFTLRDDLKWDDGTPITAADFIYTMQEQLNPLFQNYRADTFYNNSIKIHNAYNYVMQGQNTYVPSKTLYGGVYSEDLDANLIFSLDSVDALGKSYFDNWFDTKYPSYSSYVTAYGYAFILHELFGIGYDDDTEVITLEDIAALEGKTLTEIKADEALKATWDVIIGGWQTDPGEELDFFVTKYQFPAVDWNDVGLFADAENPLKFTLVMDQDVPLFKEDGETLSYHAAYDFGGLPLVKRDLYEANKVAPAMEGALWTSKYNSSVESTASWGPYKLVSFQAGKQYILERNTNWFGWNMPEFAGQYLTDRIVCETIEEYETAFLAFESGDIDEISLNVVKSATYKNSKRAIYSGDEYVGSLQLQSNGTALKNRETEGVDKEMLTYKDFRQAISVGINRADYCNKVTTASLPGYGLFNAYHYYDVENGGAYRNEDVAKEVLCNVYGVDVNAFDSLDEAYASLNGGNNLVLARALITSAYEQAIDAGTISETDKVVLTYGTSTDNENTRRAFNYLAAAFAEIAEGTPLEGRIELEFDSSFGTSWANDFRAGGYDICAGGWSGAAWNPGYFLAAYLDKQNMYSQGWDTEAQQLTFNPYGDDNAEHEYTMSLMAWWRCLNGSAKDTDPYQFNWADGHVETSFRLRIIAALEGEVLKVYYTVPMYNWYSASLISYKIEYISRDEHTFMGFGGLRYMTFNYTDEEWETVKGTFNYVE